MADLRTKIQKLAGTFGLDIVQKVTCTVNSCNVSDRTCTVTPVNSNLAQFKAQLMAEIDDGILILPKVKSTVKVLYSTMNAPTVIQFSEIDSIFFVSGGSTQLIDKSGIKLNGDKYGGIPEVQVLTDKISGLEKDLNDLKNIFSSWVVVPNDGGGALFTLLSTYKTQLFTPTVRADLENTTVQHGDGK